ncbi:MAG: hypothetical protein JW993_13995 [Sedimentisphaerales bacterium]|nr:hypothetical protein [Sedimentisphaerales bacterium]
MKKRAYVLVVLAMTLVMSCSRERPESEEKAQEGAKPQMEARKPTETAVATGTQIVCDKFELVTKVTDSTLDLSVDTDLPDNAVVMVSVSRSYLKTGDSAAYSENYFSERGTIGKWKSEHRISIADEAWKTALSARQELVSRFGASFDVASVSEKIRVSMLVPINQPDSKFGDRNRNLIGRAVTMREGGLCVVRGEDEIEYPLSAPPTGESPFPNLDPLGLDIGESYVVSKQTAVMPSHSPADPMAAIQQMRYIPQGGGFKVLEVYREKTNPWYKVIAFDQRAEQIGAGWINSTALFGQQLAAYR